MCMLGAYRVRVTDSAWGPFTRIEDHPNWRAVHARASLGVSHVDLVVRANGPRSRGGGGVCMGWGCGCAGGKGGEHSAADCGSGSGDRRR